MYLKKKTDKKLATSSIQSFSLAFLVKLTCLLFILAMRVNSNCLSL